MSMFAQKNTFSPYSRFGLGDFQSGGFGRNSAMGGVGIGLSSSYHLNDLNPASYTSMDTLSFYFEAGINGFKQEFQTTNTKSSFSDSNFSYFALGFPVSKWGFLSLGLKPASFVGYDIYDDNQSSSTSTTDENYTKSNISGQGNTNKAYAGLAIKPIKNLSLGMHYTYFFGRIDHYKVSSYVNDEDAPKFGINQEIIVNDYVLDFGFQYTYDFSETHQLTLGATYTPQTAMKGKDNYESGTGTVTSNNGKILTISDVIDSTDEDYSENAFEMPTSYGVGLSYTMKDKLTLAADYKTELWSKTISPKSNAELGDAEKMAFGVEYIPNDRSARNYLARIRYRLGTHYNKEMLIIEDQQIKDFGISFGVGLPLKRSKTSFNLAVEMGQRGTTDYNLIQENYTRFIFNMTFHERWFVKRKFK